MSFLYIPDFSEMLAVAHSRGADSETPELWDGLVGLWPIAAGGGITAYDLSGYGNHGTLTSTLDWVTTEKGRALDYFADDGHITIDSPSLTGSFTFLWFGNEKAPAQSAQHGVAGRVGGSNPGLDFGMVPNGIQRIFFDDGTAKSYQWGAGADIAGWHLWSWRWDATAEVITFGRDLAFNDVAAATETFSWTSITLLAKINTSRWRGEVALAALAGRLWSDTEIQHLYADPCALTRLRSKVYAAAVAPGGHPTMSRWLQVPGMHNYLRSAG